MTPSLRCDPRGLGQGVHGKAAGSPTLGGSDLTFSLVLRQIRLTVRTARPSVRVQAADRQHYMESDADHVVFQSAQESDEAFEQGMYRKSALLQQRCRTGG